LKNIDFSSLEVLSDLQGRLIKNAPNKKKKSKKPTFRRPKPTVIGEGAVEETTGKGTGKEEEEKKSFRIKPLTEKVEQVKEELVQKDDENDKIFKFRQQFVKLAQKEFPEESFRALANLSLMAKEFIKLGTSFDTESQNKIKTILSKF